MVRGPSQGQEDFPYDKLEIVPSALAAQGRAGVVRASSQGPKNFQTGVVRGEGQCTLSSRRSRMSWSGESIKKPLGNSEKKLPEVFFRNFLEVL